MCRRRHLEEPCSPLFESRAIPLPARLLRPRPHSRSACKGQAPVARRANFLRSALPLRLHLQSGHLAVEVCTVPPLDLWSIVSRVSACQFPPFRPFRWSAEVTGRESSMLEADEAKPAFNACLIPSVIG